jgi:hypothetical protein
MLYPIGTRTTTCPVCCQSLYGLRYPVLISLPVCGNKFLLVVMLTLLSRCDAIWFGRQLMFQRKELLPSSGKTTTLKI